MTSRLDGKSAVIAAALATVLSTGLINGAVAQTATPDAQNSKMPGADPNFSTWMNDYSKTNQGRVSRDAYMKEAGRRWDAMDQNKQGLTTDEVNRLYGYRSTPSSPDPSNLMNPNNAAKR